MPTARYVDTRRAVGGGLFGAVILGLFLRSLAAPLGLEKLDYPKLVGTYLLALFRLQNGLAADIVGWVLFAVWGVVCGLVYALYVSDRLAGPGWLQGLIYSGAGLFAISCLFLPLIGYAYSLLNAVPIRPDAPDVFAGQLVLANFLGHCLFGLMLGLVYRRRLVF
jgi:hypothetical protein